VFADPAGSIAIRSSAENGLAFAADDVGAMITLRA
jgi:hypothetical protein